MYVNGLSLNGAILRFRLRLGIANTFVLLPASTIFGLPAIYTVHASEMEIE